MGCPRGSEFWQQCIVIKSLEGGYNFSLEVRIVRDSFNTCPVGRPDNKVTPASSTYSHAPLNHNCGYALGLVYHLQAVRGRF